MVEEGDSACSIRWGGRGGQEHWSLEIRPWLDDIRDIVGGSLVYFP